MTACQIVGMIVDQGRTGIVSIPAMATAYPRRGGRGGPRAPPRRDAVSPVTRDQCRGPGYGRRAKLRATSRSREKLGLPNLTRVRAPWLAA